VKQEKIYFVNEIWVSRLSYHLKSLEDALRNKEVRVINKETTQMTLKSLADLGYFVLYGLENRYFNFDKSDQLYLHLNHLWIPFGDKRKRQRLVEIFKKNKTIVSIRSRSVGDRILSQWYGKLGKVYLGRNSNLPCEYIVHGDCVVEIYMDDKLSKKMDEAYSMKHPLSLFNEFSDITYGDHEIQIVITRNQKIADKIREQIIFTEKK
jgi:hypothetical protein